MSSDSIIEWADPTQRLNGVVNAAWQMAYQGLKELAASGEEGHDAVEKLQASMAAGAATLEVRVDLESGTARLIVHHAHHGEIQVLALVPGPAAPSTLNNPGIASA